MNCFCRKSGNGATLKWLTLIEYNDVSVSISLNIFCRVHFLFVNGRVARAVLEQNNLQLQRQKADPVCQGIQAALMGATEDRGYSRCAARHAHAARSLRRLSMQHTATNMPQKIPPSNGSNRATGETTIHHLEVLISSLWIFLDLYPFPCVLY